MSHSSVRSQARSPRHEALRFALVMLVGLGLIAAYLYFRRHRVQAAQILTGIGVLLVLLAAAIPGLVLAIRTVWMKVGGILGWLNSRVLLSVIYFLILTPFAILRRLLVRDVLQSRFPGPPGSYWQARDEAYDPKHFERSF